LKFSVAMFEVLFLYRELVDAMTPWLAQQGIQLGIFARSGSRSSGGSACAA